MNVGAADVLTHATHNRHHISAQVVAYEHTNKTYPRSGIPEYLGLALKPYVDVIMSGRSIL